jgi:hypothetical protein
VGINQTLTRKNKTVCIAAQTTLRRWATMLIGQTDTINNSISNVPEIAERVVTFLVAVRNQYTSFAQNSKFNHFSCEK